MGAVQGLEELRGWHPPGIATSRPEGGRRLKPRQTPSPACASLPDWGLTDKPCPSPNPGFSSLVVLSTKGQDPAIPQMSESEGLPWVGRLEIANDVGTLQPLPALTHGPASSPILLSHPDSASTVLRSVSGWKGTSGSRDQGSRDWRQHPCARTSKHAWVHTERRDTCHWAPLHTLCCCHLLQHESARTHTDTLTRVHTPPATCAHPQAHGMCTRPRRGGALPAAGRALVSHLFPCLDIPHPSFSSAQLVRT